MYDYFSHNGAIQPIDQAVVPLSSVEYSYGFGVYETIRVSKQIIFFIEAHVTRLLHSADVIELEHEYSKDFITTSIRELIAQNKVESCNIKVLLIGGKTAGRADLYIQCLNPLFPDRKLYKQGAHCITEHYERAYPQAKTLNMLPSYLAYRKAQRAGAYDTLLIDKSGDITEGTRTNFYALKDRTIISPPEDDILPGVTRDNVLNVARELGFTITEQPIPRNDIASFDGAFLTSTSSKIMPIRSIDDHQWDALPAATNELILGFNQFLETYAAASHR